jgi:single-strand DNA-binding protein
MALNKFFGIGYLGQDVELRYTQGGDPFARFSLAVDDSYRDRAGDKVERTIWLRCVAFGKTAENAEKLLQKGSRVQVEGSLAVNKWTDKEGNEREDLQVRLQGFTALSRKQGQGDDSDSRPAASATPSASSAPRQSNGPAPRNNAAPRPQQNDDWGPTFPSESGMDDVPF